MASSELTAAEADVVFRAARARAAELDRNDAISIAIVDAGGALMRFHRADGRWFHGEIAAARARSAAALRRDGTVTGGLLGSRAHWRSMPDMMAGSIALGPGGVLLRADEREEYHHGRHEHVLGAIGVSGAGDEDDEDIARTGARVARRAG